ncbi:hypothetical protein X777_12389 [Ooceraea biroi]|uniref:Uncharacterized protein n=1 Tax=Ooceraea biroi TaxID=2015173 RepID=A0A026VZR1_OOCBI|nr:hypothetical protein X777_12389 [Ooceraea biroi]
MQKLHFLKASVTRDAALLINNIHISDENYVAAWNFLIDEFDDESAIVQAHIHAFASLPVMKAESAKELKCLRDTVAASLSVLANLKLPVDSWDDWLVYCILQKFCKRTRTEWNLHRGGSKSSATYKKIHDFMTI